MTLFDSLSNSLSQSLSDSLCDSQLGVTVPGLANMRWLLKLYGLVMSGLGIILSLAWSGFHIFVLTVTNLQELRQQR